MRIKPKVIHVCISDPAKDHAIIDSGVGKRCVIHDNSIRFFLG